MPPAVDRRAVRAWRLRRHFLGDDTASGPEVVAARLLGVQAQVASAAEQAVAVRGPGPDEVRAALRRGSLVRTWAARGTLHLLDSARAPDLLSLLAAARTWERGAWQREFATSAEIGRLGELVAELLPGRALTREELVVELTAHVDDHLTAKLSSGWGTLFKPLAWQGLIVNGAPRGGRPTFAAPPDVVPGWRGLPDPDDAGPRVLTDYLGTYGPASPATFDEWLLRGGTARATLRRWSTELTDARTLSPVEVHDPDGTTETLLARTEDLDALVAPGPVPPGDGVRLLPAFDQWILGPGTKDPHVVPPAHRRAVSRAAGWIAPVVLRDGRVVGTWEAGPDGPAITLFAGEADLPAAALAAERERWRHLEAARAAGP